MRGEIQNRQRAQQIRDYSGLRWGTITPTDVDGAIDFGDRFYVYIEIKYYSTPMPGGQRLFYERQCDRITSTGCPACVLVVEHDKPAEEDIPVAECVVTEYRWQGAWHEPAKPITCKDAIDVLREKVGIPL